MAEDSKMEVHTDNRLPPSVLSGRASHSISGDKESSRIEEIINGVDMAARQEDRWQQHNIELCQKIDKKIKNEKKSKTNNRKLK